MKFISSLLSFALVAVVVGAPVALPEKEGFAYKRVAVAEKEGFAVNRSRQYVW